MKQTSRSIWWWGLLGLLCVVGGVGFASSREITIAKIVSSVLGVRYHPTKQFITDGIALLKASAPLEYTSTNGQVARQQVALAILDTTTGDITEHRIWISPDGNIVTQDPELPIVIRWWNSFNSFYEIDGKPELVVVANKYLIERTYLPEQTTLRLDAEAPTSRYTDMVYAPYSELLHQPDVVAAGIAYITDHATTAFQELRERRVESLAVPGIFITDVVPQDLVKTIVLVEHVDPAWLTLADDGGRALAERTLVIIGANREWAYRYTNSIAGANGLAQFIKSTYDGMVELYPAANLIKNYNLGMAEHTNAFKAISLFFDIHMKELRDKTGVEPTKEMLAAAYNGGPARVISAVNRYGSDWKTRGDFRPETIDYIKKYEMIRDLNIFK